MCVIGASQKLVVYPFQQKKMIQKCTNEEMSTSQGTVKATPSVTQKSLPCNTRNSEDGEQQDCHSNHQAEWPYLHNPPRCGAAKLYGLDAEASQKRQTQANGTNHSNQPVTGGSTASHKPTVPTAHLQWRQKVLPNIRHVHWSWHPQHTGKTNLRSHSQAQGTRKAGSSGIRQATTNFFSRFNWDISEPSQNGKQRFEQLMVSIFKYLHVTV